MPHDKGGTQRPPDVFGYGITAADAFLAAGVLRGRYASAPLMAQSAEWGDRG